MGVVFIDDLEADVLYNALNANELIVVREDIEWVDGLSDYLESVLPDKKVA